MKTEMKVETKAKILRVLRILVLGTLLGLGYSAVAIDFDNFDKLNYQNSEVVEANPHNQKHGNNGFFNFIFDEETADCEITSAKKFKEFQQLKKSNQLIMDRVAIIPRTNGNKVEWVMESNHDKVWFYQDYNDCVVDNQDNINKIMGDVPVGRKHLGGKNSIEWGKGN